MRVTTPRVDSSEASRRTLKRRSDELGKVRTLVSKGSSLVQQQNDLTKMERESLLDQAKIPETSAEIPAEDVLAMKADLSIPWNKMRILRRCVC